MDVKYDFLRISEPITPEQYADIVLGETLFSEDRKVVISKEIKVSEGLCNRMLAGLDKKARHYRHNRRALKQAVKAFSEALPKDSKINPTETSDVGAYAGVSPSVAEPNI